MALVATLISNPSRRDLTPEIVRRIARGDLPAPASTGSPTRRLRHPPGGRRQCRSKPSAPFARRSATRRSTSSCRMPTGRRKNFLIADMDSTMIGQECIDELADEVGVKDRVAAITARAMNGEIAFEPALRERVAPAEGPARSR